MQYTKIQRDQEVSISIYSSVIMLNLALKLLKLLFLI